MIREEILLVIAHGMYQLTHMAVSCSWHKMDQNSDTPFHMKGPLCTYHTPHPRLCYLLDLES